MLWEKEKIKKNNNLKIWCLQFAPLYLSFEKTWDKEIETKRLPVPFGCHYSEDWPKQEILNMGLARTRRFKSGLTRDRKCKSGLTRNRKFKLGLTRTRNLKGKWLEQNLKSWDWPEQN